MRGGTSSPKPAPQTASASAAHPEPAEGSSARATNPAARSSAPVAPPAAGPVRCDRGRTATAASGSALTTAAPASGPSPHAVTIIRTARKSAPTSAPKAKTSPRFGSSRTRGTGPPSGASERTPGATRQSSAAAATGAWARKMARQSKSWVRMPPAAGPSTAPSVPARPHHARPAAVDPVRTAMTGSDAASRRAPPSPWTARRAISAVRSPTSPQASEEPANTTSPAPTSRAGRILPITGTTASATSATTRL